MEHEHPSDVVDIPGFRIKRRIGRGGMATVYLATQRELGRTVALKVLLPERMPDTEAVARFEQETRTIAQLSHPHIVSIHEVGRTDDGYLYYSMPFLPRGDLASRSRHGQPCDVMTVMRALLGALAYAHEQGVIHRDVKPANIMFDAHDQPQLTDFGIALNTREELHVTRVGATVGSSGYMSPEQARGLPADNRSDLYSAGVVFYELLTGDLPYHGPDALSVAIAHAEDPVPSLPARLNVWQEAIDGALAKQPEDRFSSAAQMLAALETAAQRAGDEDQGGHRLRQWWRGFWYRYRRGTLYGGVALLAILAAIVLLVVLSQNRVEPYPSAAPIASLAKASTTAPSAPMLSADQLDQLLASGNTKLHAGALVEPAGRSAADDFQRVLKNYPSNPEALSGINAVLNAFAKRIEHALDSGDTQQTLQLYQQAQTLASRGGVREQLFWPAFVDQVDAAVARTLKRSAHDSDQQRADLQKLATTFHQPLPPRAPPATPARGLQIGAALRDGNGPAMVVVSLAAGHAYAVGRHEITRSQYADFIKASRRPASSCRKLGNVFSALGRLSWQDPGFKQGDSAPAVCISWHDARAYLGWLSQTSGERYRLPTESEWNAAQKLTGKLAPTYRARIQNWLLCTGNCSRVSYRGNIEHGSSRPDTGYTSVGLRVLREI